MLLDPLLAGIGASLIRAVLAFGFGASVSEADAEVFRFRLRVLFPFALAAYFTIRFACASLRSL